MKRGYKGHLLIPAHRQVGAVLWQLVSPGLWGAVEGIHVTTGSKPQQTLSVLRKPEAPSFGPVEAGGKLTEGTGPAEGVGVSL